MTIQDEGAKWEDIAVGKFEAMVKKARTDKVTNEWLKQAIVMLNEYKPSEYPLPKEERATYIWNDSWSVQMRGFVAPDTSKTPNTAPNTDAKPSGPVTAPANNTSDEVAP
jgi:hypothetical protein